MDLSHNLFGHINMTVNGDIFKCKGVIVQLVCGLLGHEKHDSNNIHFE